MKLKVLNIITSLFITACLITSCLDDDTIEYVYSSNASITGFSIKDSIITRYKTQVDGVDTTLSTAIVGANYPFVINQHEGLIYNPDSLPVGTDISKVVVSITADTYGIFIVAETDSIWEETDSLNFEKPVQFKVMAENGVFGRTYSAKINVHQQEPDTLMWQQMDANFSTAIEAQKAVYANGSIYVFAEQDAQVAVTSTNDGKAWTELQSIDIPAKADYTSAMAWNNQLYILANNELYLSTNGVNWSKAETTQTFSRLLANIDASSCQKLIGADTENRYIESKDGIQWDSYEVLPEEFPTGSLSFASYPLTTNDQLYRVVLIGENKNLADTTNVAWEQLDSEHEWIALSTDANGHECPNLKNPSMIRYNNQLYYFGGPGRYKGNNEAFNKFYISKDNGITWNSVKKDMGFPATFKDLYDEAKGNYSCVVDENNFLWIMWSQTGEVWRSRINKLGFIKQ